jgi:uncharacterized protein YegP (UPF0339 family)
MKTKTKTYRFSIFRGENLQWYWNLKHRNGKIVADGSEGYKRKSACIRSLTRIIAGIETAGFQIEEAE